MDLGRLPPFQRARRFSARGGSGLTRRARRAPVCSRPFSRCSAGRARWRNTVALDPRRDDDQERHDWAQWDERTNDRPHRPSPSTAHWRTPLAS